MTFIEKLRKYAKAVIKVGVNIVKDDNLIIRADIDAKELVYELTKAAYEEGAASVDVIWKSDFITRKDFEFKKVEDLENVNEWIINQYDTYVKKGGKFISIIGTDPNNLKGLDEKKVRKGMIAMSKALSSFRKALMNDENSWTVIGAATPAWAKIVFPELDEKEAISKLWDLIFYTSRIDNNDSVLNWKLHLDNLHKKAKELNEMKLKYLRYSSKKGTNLEIELPKGHIWISGSGLNSKNEEFTANMPTEEVYTLAHKDGVNGIVYSTKPLNFSGNLIEDFWLEFKNGKVINYDAKKGLNILKSLLETDEGALSLGEVALVPNSSPISTTNTMFFETLYDENASCHLALGRAYPTCIENGVNLSEEELTSLGVNNSLVHEDFMIGDETLNIIGITEEGKEMPIFIDGEWAY